MVSVFQRPDYLRVGEQLPAYIGVRRLLTHHSSTPLCGKYHSQLTLSVPAPWVADVTGEEQPLTETGYSIHCSMVETINVSFC